MPKNTMDDLRNHLFATIEALQDDENPMAIERAKAVCEVADRLIETAKVEVKVYDLIGGSPEASSFLALPAAAADEKPKPRPVAAIMPPSRPA